jgi:hypothetical protein
MVQEVNGTEPSPSLRAPDLIINLEVCKGGWGVTTANNLKSPHHSCNKAPVQRKRWQELHK